MIDFNFTVRIYKEITAVDNEFLINEFHEKAIEYARIRTDWFFISIEEKRVINKNRTIKHDAFIDSINAISRYMKNNEQDNSWYDDLPDFRSQTGRKEWGDIACYTHCYLGLLSR